MSAETFASVYQAAIYKADGIAFVLTEKPTGVVLFQGRKFAIITAQNPQSEPLSETENQQRNQALEKDLKSLRLEYTLSTGENPNGTWIEEGFAVFDVELEQTLELGRKHGQHAILWGEGEKVYLAWCETGKLEKFYAKRNGQKHSRLTPEGRLYWMTERLWEYAKHLPEKTIPISSIKEFDQNCWFFSLEEATCKSVANHAKQIVDADLSYPIVLSAEGMLMDGGHRIAKAWIYGISEIKAVQFTTDPEPDWIEKSEEVQS